MLRHTTLSISGNTQFQTTRWTLIASARDRLAPDSRAALSELCRMYWYPLYAFIRRRGSDAQSASDLIQGFFVELIEGRLLSTAQPDKGRFRSYLLGALKHYLSNEYRKATAQKRGGSAVQVSIDDAETRYRLEPIDGMSPERIYERRWALTVLESAMHALQNRYAASGKAKQFAILKDLLAGPLPDRSYAQIADELETTESAIKTAVHRLRIEFRHTLEAMIAETVRDCSEIDGELRHLSAAISIS